MLNYKLTRTKDISKLSYFFLAIVIVYTLTRSSNDQAPYLFFAVCSTSGLLLANILAGLFDKVIVEKERNKETIQREGRPVIGAPPRRDCFEQALKDVKHKDQGIINKYLVGFEVDTGNPLWVKDDDLCGHACVFAKTGVGKTLWLESILFQQMARGRASGCTFIDAKRDSTTLAHIILMAFITGRIEDLIVIDPFDPIHSYNFVLTHQRADVKARKVLRAGLPPAGDQSVIKHYDRLAADSIYRMVRALESLGFTWSLKDIGAALSAFHVAYPKLQRMLSIIGAEDALVELSHLASSYRTSKGSFDSGRFTENLRGISAELNAISGSEMGKIFCSKSTDLVLTDAILRGKIIYFMLPRLEEAESASRMVKLFREDLEVAIGEVTSSRQYLLEDPHLVVIDEGSSTFGPTWANLFELARKGRFALLFGAQSTGALTDTSLGLSEAFYARVMANVNLKVMMRVGDNRTASDMAQWIGKDNAGDATSKTTQDESVFSGSDELKHEMYAEKGLAWFDLGDGRIVKGRSFWFDADLPPGWDGRNLVPLYDQHINDDIGLADWVDSEILQREKDASKVFSGRDDNRDYSSAAIKSESDVRGQPHTTNQTTKNTPTSASPVNKTNTNKDKKPFRLGSKKKGSKQD